MYSNYISDTEYLKAAYTLTAEENAREQRIREAAIEDAKAELAEQERSYMNYMEEAAAQQAKAANFFSNAKTALLSEAIHRIFTESMSIPMDKQMKNISRNLVNRFVKENGTQMLLSSFRTKNLLLSEVSRIVNKYYDKIVTECGGGLCGDCTPTEFVVPDDITNDFLDEIKDLDMEDASKLIKERVTDSITQFMDANALAKLEYEEILQSAQDHIDTLKDTDPNAEIKAQESAMIAKREIQEREAVRDRNVFHCIVQNLAEASIKDEQLKAIYVEGSKVNMDKIVEHAHLFMNLLEMANTTEMIVVDEQYIDKYLKSMM